MVKGVRPQRAGPAKIKDRSRHAPHLTGGQKLIAHRGVGLRRQTQGVVVDRARAIQIEVGVVCQIDHRVLVGTGLIADGQPIPLHLVCDQHIQIAGETVLAVGAVQAEGHRLSVPLLRSPQPLVEPLAAVETTAALLICRQAVPHPVQSELCPGNAVGIAANGGPQVAPLLGIEGGRGVAEYHAGPLSVDIGGLQFYQGGSKIADRCPQPVTLQHVQPGCPAIRQRPPLHPLHTPIPPFSRGLRSRRSFKILHRAYRPANQYALISKLLSSSPFSRERISR